MYTETRNNFSMRSVILRFLFIALFVFILIWLFPTKSDMKKAASSNNSKDKTVINNTDLSVLYDRIFNENLTSMKEAAQSYYTTERLPQKVGETTKITLREMLDKKIILPFKDKNGKQCDLDKSYVQITKENNEFVMKVNLKCGEEENYLLTYMGCYDYCSKTICEKKGYTGKVYKVTTAKKTTTKTVVKQETKKYYCKVVNGKYYDNKGNVVSKVTYQKACTKPTTVTKYYCKVVNGKYYDRNGNTVTKEAYKSSCEPTIVYYCAISNGKYYDNNGKIVTKEAYQEACEKKPVCKIVNGKYYDRNGKVVSKEAYQESCEPTQIYYCKVVNGKYYDRNGNIVTESAYKSSCEPAPVYYCKIVNGKYYDNNGHQVTEAAYKKACLPVEYEYEYKKETQQVIKYSEWSAWSETYVAPSSTVEVQAKDVKYRKLTGYNVTTEDDLTKPIEAWENTVVASTTTKSCVSYNVTSTITGYEESYVGTVKLTSAPTSTSTTRYEYVGTYNWYCDGDCTSGTVYLYKMYQRKPVTSTGYTCAKYDTFKTAYVTKQLVVTGYQKKETKTPVYDYYTKTQYRYRTKTITPGSIKRTYSFYNNLELLNAGYTYTGAKRVKAN